MKADSQLPHPGNLMTDRAIFRSWMKPDKDSCPAADSEKKAHKVKVEEQLVMWLDDPAARRPQISSSKQLKGSQEYF